MAIELVRIIEIYTIVNGQSLSVTLIDLSVFIARSVLSVWLIEFTTDASASLLIYVSFENQGVVALILLICLGDCFKLDFYANLECLYLIKSKI